MASSTEMLSHDFSPRSSCEIPGFYRIHLSQTNVLLDKLNQSDPDFATLFESIVYGDFDKTTSEEGFMKGIETLKTNYENFKKISEQQGKSTKPYDKLFIPLIQQEEKAFQVYVNDKNQKLATDNGYDIVAIKVILHQILGLDEYSHSPEQAFQYKIQLSNEEKARYFQIFKNTGFLETPFDSLDNVVYEPAKTIKKILEMNPQINSLLVGCGRRVVYFHQDKCNNKDQMIAEHTDTALSIDVDINIDPHLLASIFDVAMLQSIPGERIKLISDHSNGFLNLEAQSEEESTNKQAAFSEFYRILKPKGRIEHVSIDSDADKEILERIGFIVTNSQLLKPDLSNLPADYVLTREVIDEPSSPRSR